jgi:hypothetical protein
MSITTIINRVNSRIDDVVRAKTIQLFKSIIDMTPVGNADLWKNPENKPTGYVGGHARANWQCTIGAPYTGEIDGTNFTQTTTDVINTVPEHAGMQVFLTNNVPYIGKLEYNAHSSQAPAGMVRVSIQRVIQ